MLRSDGFTTQNKSQTMSNDPAWGLSLLVSVPSPGIADHKECSLGAPELITGSMNLRDPPSHLTAILQKPGDENLPKDSKVKKREHRIRIPEEES